MHSCHLTFGPFNYKTGITLFTVALLILSGRLYAFSGLDFYINIGLIITIFSMEPLDYVIQ